ncbi:MAG TPA: hypothetical protein VL069_07455, partial [Opitutus sp.]|nr:hypothetical protein [Opitutus sp.]
VGSGRNGVDLKSPNSVIFRVPESGSLNPESHGGHGYFVGRSRNQKQIPRTHPEKQLAAAVARLGRKLMRVFDEGCKGNVQRHYPHELLFSTAVYKERLSLSALYYAATQVTEAEGRAVYEWLKWKDMIFTSVQTRRRRSWRIK